MADATIILQVLTLIVAGAGPLLAYRYARKLAISGNRQAWLDGLRQDVSELIAFSDAAFYHFRHKDRIDDAASGARELALKMQTVRFRVQLRLQTGNEAHQQLKEAMEAFLGGCDLEERNRLRVRLVDCTEVLIQRACKRIEQGE